MDNKNENKLYIALLSIHGLIRSQNLELGRDADTGGQTKYVVELTKKLAGDPRIERIDLFTRKIIDPKIDDDYAQSVEPIADNANIIRIACGPKRYLRKEVLWPYLDGFSDATVQHFRNIGKIPDLIHAHYADAGYVGAQVARLLGVPFIFTGHSLGRVKKARLKEKGMPLPKMEARYNISHRIDAEEFALDTASLVVASTDQEVNEQYELYENYDPKRMVVIPPGVNLDLFFPYTKSSEKPKILSELERFLTDTDRPIVLALSRADERKNIGSLIKAFGENKYLKENANLIVFAGNRDDIRKLDSNAKNVLSNILYLIDKYDLYGRAAYPKHHEQDDVPEIYRLTAKLNGVFVNPALTEPFGLTLLEAGACGVPLVATNDGGPTGIIGKCENGELIDPLDTERMGKAIQSIIEDRSRWQKLSKNGISNVKKYYSWRSHATAYLDRVENIIEEKYYSKNLLTKSKSKLPIIDRLIITDIDNTLLGDEEGLKRFLKLLDETDANVGFSVATGRRLTSAIEVLNKWQVRMPDILITSVGSEIYYGLGLVRDRSWEHHLDFNWQPEKIREVLDELPGLRLQPEEDQRKYKISYYIDNRKAPGKRKIIRALREKNLKVKVIHSHNAYLDILPIRASKGLAIRYLVMKWNLTPERILVAGDSGNDEEMLRGHTLGVVVGNYSSELKHLYGKPRIYFADQTYSDGIIEGIKHYNFLDEIRVQG